MTKETTAKRNQERGGMGAGLACCIMAATTLALANSGCASLPWKKKKNDDGLTAPTDSVVLNGKGMEKYYGVLEPALQGEMDAAHRHFLNKEYDEAEDIFARILKEKKLPVNVAEDALFHEADCQYQTKNYRDAAATFRKHLRNYPNGPHAQQSVQRLFSIADYWLEGTRAEMKARSDGSKSWFVVPANWSVHFGKDMPAIDVESHALQALEEVRLNDIGGPYGEQACFYIATVKFFREKYRDADYYFTHLYQHYPNSKLAPKALKQAIMCKQICTGGSCYDCRTVEETRKLLDVAPAAYPSMAGKESDWLEKQLIAVNMQQADRDFNIAEFYRRTGHPGSAYFYYEIVRRSYPNTPYSEKAVDRMRELRDRVERESPGATADGPAGPTSTPTPVPAASAAPRMLPPAMVPPGVAR